MLAPGRGRMTFSSPPSSLFSEGTGCAATFDAPPWRATRPPPRKI